MLGNLSTLLSNSLYPHAMVETITYEKVMAKLETSVVVITYSRKRMYSKKKKKIFLATGYLINMCFSNVSTKPLVESLHYYT